MLTLSLLAFIKFYIGDVIILFLLFSLFNALTTGFSIEAFKLVKPERIFIFIWPILEFFIRILFTGPIGFIIGLILFVITITYLRKKFPD